MTRPSFDRALVTGAAGFIGAHLACTLARAGVEVHAVVRPSANRWRLQGMGSTATVHAADLTDARSVAELVADVRPEVVFHAAASSVHHPVSPAERSATVADTVLGTVSVCEAAAAAGSRLVHLGSFLEYGPAGRPLAEGDPVRPTTFRGASKSAATVLCRQIAADAGLRAVVLRVFSVYGPWEAANRLVPTVLRSALTGAPLRLTRPGVRHDFVFVADVVDACLRAAVAPDAPGEIINVGSGVESTNEEVVRVAGEVAGVALTISPDTYPERLVDTDHSCADISKARRLLGWEPGHSLADGLAESWHWFRSHAAIFASPAGRGR